MRLKVYLAGPIMGRTDAEVFGWREDMKRRLFFADTIDPTARDYRGIKDMNVSEIVEGDKADIDACDVLLAHTPHPSAGTSMEIMYAFDKGKYVAIMSKSPVSPWIQYHSHYVSEFPSEIAGDLFRQSLRG